MKKTITIMAILATLIFTGCGQKSNPEEFFAEHAPVVNEVSVPTIDANADTAKEESIEESAEAIDSPIDFELKVNEKLNVEAIIKHAHELGLLENTWNSPAEIKADDMINAYGLKYKAQWEAFPVDEATSATSIIVEIPQADIDDMIAVFVAVPADNLHQAEKYDIGVKSYQFPTELKTVASEEKEAVWAVKAGDVKVVIENIYEISLIDITDESAPTDFGVLTVEDNQGVPWYISFVKAAGAEGSETGSSASSSTGSGGQTGSSTSSTGGTTSSVPATSSSTTSSGSGNTNSSSGSTSSGGKSSSGSGNTNSSSGSTSSGGKSSSGDVWGGTMPPGDPNVETDKGDDLSHIDWK